MKVDLAHQNIGLVSLFENHSQVITLDANFFIPPSRDIPDNLCAIQMYEIIYYMYRLKVSSTKDLRMLYKYQYHLTKSEKRINPQWSAFLIEMDKLYGIIC